MCILCLLRKVGNLSPEADRIAFAMFKQLYNQHQVLKQVIETFPTIRSTALDECMNTGDIFTREGQAPKPSEPSDTDPFAGTNITPINRTKH